MLSTVGRWTLQRRSHLCTSGPASYGSRNSGIPLTTTASQPWSSPGRLRGMDIFMVKGASPDAAREVILDTRASGFLTGSSTVVAYLTYLPEEGGQPQEGGCLVVPNKAFPLRRWESLAVQSMHLTASFLWRPSW